MRRKKEFVDSFQKSFKDKKNTLWSNFISYFFESAPSQTLENPKDQALIEQVKRAWTFYQKRTSSFSFQYNFDPLRHTFTLEILQSDQPFILETLKNLLSAYHFQPSVIYHPVIKSHRDKKGHILDIHQKGTPTDSKYQFESLISVEILYEGLEDSLKSFIEEIHWRMNLVHLAVSDWPKMRQRFQKMIPKKHHPEQDFFEWLCQDNFLFLGMRFFPQNAGKSSSLSFSSAEESLGIFRDEKTSRKREFFYKSIKASEKCLFHIEKTAIRSPINRPARIDVIEVFDKEKKGIFQIIGIFTRHSYTHSIFHIPLLKARAQRIFKNFDLKKTWHDGKMLIKALESIPHDEYWSFSDHSLSELCGKVLSFDEHALPCFALCQSDRLKSSTVLVFLGKERYNNDLKYTLGNFFAKNLGGVLTSTRGIVDDAPFARMIFAIDKAQFLHKNTSDLQKELEILSLNWEETRSKLQKEAYQIDPFEHFFSQEYQKDFTPQQALTDAPYFLRAIAKSPYVIRIEKQDHDQGLIRLYSYGAPVSLSSLLDVLQNFGITVAQEKTYPLQDNRYFLHLCHASFSKMSHASIPEHLGSMIEETIAHHTPNDRFNTLALTCGFQNHQIMTIRAFCEYCLQAGYAYTFHFMAVTLCAFPTITTFLMEYFEKKFSPKEQKRQKKEKDLQKLSQKFLKELEAVSNSEQDQFLRDLKSLIDAMVRTNCFLDKEAISFKIQSSLVPRLGDPKPLFETFVSASSFQGIHLRTSRIARGGIRHSDRTGDFRMEILQLMQAQDLKNALIVPTGAKGGFVLKNEASSENIIKAYTLFIQSLLDITDNVQNGHVLTPPNVFTWDEHDPYLVVAADKGTSSFSDIANEIASDYKFWLGNAFASGGSQGYNHKDLGITAKGAFVSIRHHFRKKGIDLSKTPITVAGVGDMAGDVFGNGMILHDTLKLVAAFNHRHIFIDPSPDPKASFAERVRLFQNPSLTWGDYDKKILSEGGAIYERTSKTIHLSPEASALLTLPSATTPTEVIQKILSLPVDLLYFGGIGTFIKGEEEIYTGDHGNNALRISAKRVQARVIGEGANLAITPLARIELAQKCVLLNSDAIDNAGGVNCSDHEVNLKILLRHLPSEKRDALLLKLTGDVEKHVLQGNDRQNYALDIMEKEARTHHEAYCDLILALEKQTDLKRATVFLEKDEILRKRTHPLTRPELAIVLSYTKIALKKHFLEHYPLLKNHHENALHAYFPASLKKDFKDAMKDHLLHKELAVLSYVNHLIGEVGALEGFRQSIPLF